MSRSTVNKRYWSGIKNVHKRLNNTDSDGVNARKKYLELTGDSQYKEKNFQKVLRSGTGSISLLNVRKNYASIRNKKKILLKKEYKEIKDQRDNRIKILKSKLKSKRKKLKSAKSTKRKNKLKSEINNLRNEISFERQTLDSQEKFIKNNLHEDQDWQDIRELFNSP